MKIEEHYWFESENFDASGKHRSLKNTYFNELIRHFLMEFYIQYGRIFHPTTLVMSGLSMKKLERSEQMDEEYYFGIITLNGRIDNDYNVAIARKESRQNVIAISSDIPEHDDEPVYLFIDEKLDNNTVIVRWLSDNDDDDNDSFELGLPVSDPKKALVYV